MTTLGDHFLKSPLYRFCLWVDIPLRCGNARVARDSRQRESITPSVSKIRQRRVSQAVRFEGFDFG